MDEKQAENTIPVGCLDNIDLPSVTADLEMLTIDANSSSMETKRVLRKRLSKSASPENHNRRCTLRPKKKLQHLYLTEENVKEYYLDKRIKKKSNNLETIYEEGDNASDDAAIRMSVKRFKRMLLFSPTNSKLKRRRAKIQKAFGSKYKVTFKMPSKQPLLDKLSTLSLMKIDSELK